MRTILKEICLRITPRSKHYFEAVMPGGHSPSKKFFVFAQGRTGSTLLCRLLNGHSQIDCREEIFHNVWRPFPVTFATGVSKSAHQPVFGFKVKIYQLTDRIGYPEPAKFLQKMHARGWKIIYLWRRNVLRQAISRQIAKNKDMWHNTDKNHHLVENKVFISPDKVLEVARERARYQEREKQALKGLPYLTINYEDDLLRKETHEVTLHKAFDYLNLPFEQTSAGMQRTSVDDLSKMIRNYDSFRQVIKTSDYGHLLDD